MMSRPSAADIEAALLRTGIAYGQHWRRGGGSWWETAPGLAGQVPPEPPPGPSLESLPDDCVLAILAQALLSGGGDAAARVSTRFKRLYHQARAVRLEGVALCLRLSRPAGPSTRSCAELPLWPNEGATPREPGRAASLGFDISCEVRTRTEAGTPPLLLLGDWVGLLPVAERPRQPAPCLRLLGSTPTHVAARVRALPETATVLEAWTPRCSPARWRTCRLRVRNPSAAVPGRCEWRGDGALVAIAALREPIELRERGANWWLAPSWADAGPESCDLLHLRLAHWAAPQAEPTLAHWPLSRPALGAGRRRGTGDADADSGAAAYTASEREVLVREQRTGLHGSVRGAVVWAPESSYWSK